MTCVHVTNKQIEKGKNLSVHSAVYINRTGTVNRDYFRKSLCLFFRVKNDWIMRKFQNPTKKRLSVRGYKLFIYGVIVYVLTEKYVELKRSLSFCYKRELF